MRRVAALGMFVVCTACVGPRTPSTIPPFTVRLLGASDDGLRGTMRSGHGVFSGSEGRDYAVEVTNHTAREVGVAILIDGLDARTGEPAASCEGHAIWILASNGIGITRGFTVSKTSIATYRFTKRDESLAALTKHARPERIGTVEVCIFSTRPIARASGNEASPDSATPDDAPTWSAREGRAPLVTGALRAAEPSNGFASSTPADLVARIVVRYEGESGPLGTAPPPPLPARPNRNAHDEPGEPPPEPPKPEKRPRPKPTKTPDKAGSDKSERGKPEKDK